MARTGDIGLFKITAEYGIASGIRRIELVTGGYALDWVNQQLEVLEETAVKLKTTIANLPEKLSQFLHDLKLQEKELARLNAKVAAQSGADLLTEVQSIKGVNLLVKQLDNEDSQTLRGLLDQLKSRLDNAVIVLIATTREETMSVVVGVSKSLLGRVPTAKALVKHLCGKGGGREDMAQGGGRVPCDLNLRMTQIPAMIAEHMG